MYLFLNLSNLKIKSLKKNTVQIAIFSNNNNNDHKKKTKHPYCLLSWKQISKQENLNPG